MIGIVYKIIGGNEVYIGSTIQLLNQRKGEHKTKYKKWKEGKHRKCYSFVLFEKYGFDKCEFIVLKEYDVVDRLHLEVYETLWICKYKKVIVNQCIPFKINYLYKKEYYKENKEQIIEYQQRYREENKDHILEQTKRYREKNKDKIKKERSKSFYCECGSVICRYSISNHKKTIKHQKWLKQNDIQ